jgi:hypothetical protein
MQQEGAGVASQKRKSTEQDNTVRTSRLPSQKNRLTQTVAYHKTFMLLVLEICKKQLKIG